ncbi:MAG: hypothetical protein A2600_10550 [Candidatus Lambdaproteobacteria bacterium RIFOXYD1_FULL_56_27]|uniref:Uncharacterized protein n=1 Tax=Candidatus Lambdaproteobacteria bacterium RIFOXYD2_FULL_56_26 TaxID=1817773 RepID=A0A1F6GZF0_9PROT|nr:MAG: hypothetical protein A2426_00995 [Candidatus Lambdaproteobacteria bacterium RIFOXYC1_FULL_56_13]OGH03431.1 MAG: hypothetical protein A2557_01610 [Candidatus Lambdaproteobacteria bacterium RIFOXYD2_FULL_56_26]OGH08216.1 MAG: hypothetical protein A2600_10550 [Candidatus Lambdaproteobacteria bacterium RIFOXYD1_FULL_56_27]
MEPKKKKVPEPLNLVKSFLLVLLGLSLFWAAPAWSQEAATPAPKAGGTAAPEQGAPPAELGPDGQPLPPPLPYSERIYQAQTALGWAKVYFESYKRSKEYRYLKLGGDYCLRSIQILYQTQGTLKRTERFYYQTRNQRVYACDFYQALREASFSFESNQYLADPPGAYCSF